MNKLQWKKKVREVKRRVKLPTWMAISILALIVITVSAYVSSSITNKKINRLIKQLPYLESNYIMESGRYPDWFIEWQNTVYLNGGNK